VAALAGGPDGGAVPADGLAPGSLVGTDVRTLTLGAHEAAVVQPR